MTRTRTALLAFAAASGLALTGCAVDQTQSGTAEGAGPLTIACGAMEDLCQKWTETFTAATGIDATYVRLSSGETVARLDSAKDNPEFDVWHGGPVDGYGAAAEKGLIEAYDSPSAAPIPDKYKDAEHYWTGVYVGVLGFCSNQTVLDGLGVKVPTTWDDLLNPALKGQVSTAHPSTSGTAFTTLWTQRTRLGGDDAAFDYMKKLHNNVLQYTKSGTAPGQIAGRGEVGVALIANSKNKEAAQKYIDWAISPDAQNVGQTVGSYQVLTHPDAKTDERMVNLDDVKLIDYDFGAAAAAKPELTARFDEESAAQPKE